MWQIIQCAVQGRHHVKYGTPCQDKTYVSKKNGVVAAALADGAGSAKMSHYGAECVVKYICDELTDKFDLYYNESDADLTKMMLIDNLLEQLTELKNSLQCSLKDLSSTLLAIAIKGEQFILIHIGDGVIGCQENKKLKTLSKPQNGEFSNVTFFVTSENALTDMNFIKGNLNDMNGFVLMSDGTSTSMYNKRTNEIVPVLKKIMQMCTFMQAHKIEEQLQNSFETVIRGATGDDCSIIILKKGADNFTGYENMSIETKCRILKLNKNSIFVRSYIKRYDRILTFLNQKRSLTEIAHYMKLNEKYIKNYIDRLLKTNLIEECDSTYQTIVIMKK